jgi:hypothetical protein
VVRGVNVNRIIRNRSSIMNKTADCINRKSYINRQAGGRICMRMQSEKVDKNV